jgi:sortase A
MTTRSEAGEPTPTTPSAVGGDAVSPGPGSQAEENGQATADWPEPYPDLSGSAAASVGVSGPPAGGWPAVAQAEAPAPAGVRRAGGYAPRPGRAVRPASAGREQILRAVGAGVLLLGVFLLGLVGYLYALSGVQEARTQTTLYATLSGQMANAVAPTGPVAPGTPVAVLTIPAIGMHDVVVVEGTSPEDLTLGPGHLRSTPLPGQGGVSEIYGRRAMFGAPFGRVPQLGIGDTIKVATGQGMSTYRVTAFGSSSRLVQNPAPNQLILLTAGSAAVPTYFTYVDADLTSAVQPEPGGLPPIYQDETALSGDDGALVTALLWALALAGVSTASTFALTRWSPWPVYLAAAPIALAVLWNLYQSLAALLPNVY